ncbi:MAG TPA: glycosyltransferase [Candidatus Binatia bacterium]|nr:glycosyltransferase [Candidatus Binatia bacterium]
MTENLAAPRPPSAGAMIRARLLMSSQPGRVAETVPLLSIVALCHSPDGETGARRLLDRFTPPPTDIEVVVVIEPTSSTSPSAEFAEWCRTRGCIVLAPANPCGLDALRFDEGVLASGGRWIWLIDSRHDVPALKADQLRSLLAEREPSVIPFLLHPEEESPDRTRWIEYPLIATVFRGHRIPFENVFFPRQVFATFGLLDPHIVLSSYFRQEFLLRICRSMQFEPIREPLAERLGTQHFPPLLYQWVDADRCDALVPARLGDYAVDDLQPLSGRITDAERWRAYVECVLPYYYDFRHVLPDGLPAWVQSRPPLLRHVVCVKEHYDTTVDVGIRNFDVFAQGRNGFKLSNTPALELYDRMAVDGDALLLVRTVDPETLRLAERSLSAGVPVAYSLDDDLLHFHELGGTFATFRPGDAAYDAMVAMIGRSDVVLCGGPHVCDVVHAHNARTVHFGGSLLAEFLRDHRAPTPRMPFVFAYAGGSYRSAEMRMLWPAIRRICEAHGSKVRFELWGINPDEILEPIAGVTGRRFSFHYYEYLTRLTQAGFHATLVPLFDEPSPRRGKLPNKVYETAAAGAVGLYSDVATYGVVKTHDLGVIVPNSPEAWYEAMQRVLTMHDTEYHGYRERGRQFVREFYTTPAMLPVHEQGLHALFFHAATRGARGADGRPCVLYVLPGATGTGAALMRQQLDLAQKAGIAPVAVVPESAQSTAEWERLRRDFEATGIAYDCARYRVLPGTPPSGNLAAHADDEASVRALLGRHRLALVQSWGHASSFGKVCAELQVPHVVLSAGADDAYEWLDGLMPEQHCAVVQSDSIRSARKWAQLYGSEWLCARGMAPEALFGGGFARLYGRGEGDRKSGPIRLGVLGALAPRNSQLEIIAAVGSVVRQGYNLRLAVIGDTPPSAGYAAQCQEAAKRLELDDGVTFEPHPAETASVYQRLDVVLSVSTDQSFPDVIREATAAGVLVIASPAGEICEVMKDGVNAILTSGTSAEAIAAAILRAVTLPETRAEQMRRNAFHLARQEFHPRRALLDLLSTYDLALTSQSGRRSPAMSGGATYRARPTEIIEEIGSAPLGYAPLGRRWRRYVLAPSHQHWKAVKLLLGTPLEQEIRGRMEFRLTDSRGDRIRAGIADLVVHDASGWWIRLDFPTIADTAGQQFVLTVRLVKPRPHHVGAFESRPTRALGQKIAKRLGLPLRDGSPYMRLVFADEV